MSGETEGLRLVRDLHRIWSTGDRTLVARVYHPEFVAYWPPSSPIPVRRGREAVLAGLDGLRAGFPDWHESTEDAFATGDRVADRFLSVGTHLGPFAGLDPTGRRVEIMELGLYRVRDGFIVEQWCLFDEVARLRQLGVNADYLREVLRR